MNLRSLKGWLFNWGKDEQDRYRPGLWQQAWTGTQYYALDPREDEIHFDDICVGLAREGRYANQSREFLSVAEHSVIVSQQCERLATERGWTHDNVLLAARQGFFHDGSEAYIGDLARPIKRQRVMKGYCKVEAKWERCINRRFNIKPTQASTDLVKEVDNRIVLDEVEAIMYDPDMWQRTNRYPGVKPLGVEIAALPWQQAAQVFARRYLEIFVDINKASDKIAK